MTGTGVVDARLPLEGFDFSGAPRWHVLLLCGRAPVERVDLASPGAVSGDALANAALVRRADYEIARQHLIDHLRRRIASSAREDRQPTVSVVVCTHRRPRQLATLLESLNRLDPRPFEVVVVDNDPGETDCRPEVEASGFRYIREDRRGLDNARNAGLRAARGEVISFIDDDCVASPHWLQPLAAAFAHDGVAAVTGPAFPYLLDTQSREMMERKASLARGMRRIAFDWQTMSPMHAAAMGVGANMSFRRELLPDRAEPFPPELDAGTETESGGDSYLLGRVLDAGYRVVYEPEMFVFHQHRDDPGALRKAVVGYGIGLSAALTKLVLEERELTAPRAWSWLVKQYLWTQRRRAVGRSNAVETRLSWEYLRGGFLGSERWVRALRTQREARLALGDAQVANQATVAEEPAIPDASQVRGAELVLPIGGEDAPAVSVIIPTYRREDALGRCLRALAEQDIAAGAFEVVVVDDDPESKAVDGDQSSEWPFQLRRLRNSGKGAAAARNHGAREAAAPLLLFIDDDVVADRSLVHEHLRWHREHNAEAVLVGPYRPRPKHDNLAAQVARLWWQDLFDMLEEAEGTTFIAALTANVSLHRSTFDRTGGLSEAYSKERREDWEWGLRMLRSGVPIAFHAEASARHEFTLGTEQRLRDARREGYGDTLIAADYPEAVESLPLHHVRRPSLLRPLRWIATRAWELEPARWLTVRALSALEWGRIRGLWLRLFRVAEGLSYEQGAYAGGWPSGPGSAAKSTDVRVELLSSEPLEPPDVVAPAVRATIGGAEVARVIPKEGLWTASLAEQIVDAIEWNAVVLAATRAGWIEVAEAHDHASETEVVFGPASTFWDLSGRADLEACGAAVRVASGEPGRHWEAVADEVRKGDRPLVAIPLPGTCPQPVWLADALAAFDGERVGLVFGAAAAHELPLPLYLHDDHFADRSLTLVGKRPAYVVIRRELALGLHEDGNPVEPVIAEVSKAFERGWVVGHRECRGLRPPRYKPLDRGRAYGRLEAARALALPRSQRGEAIAREAGRGALVVAWLLFKQRGLLNGSQRGLAAGVSWGALGGLLSRMRRG